MKSVKQLLNKIWLWNSFFSKKQQYLLAILLFIGLMLRTINAFATQLWRDEMYIIITSRDNSFISLLLQQHWDTAHPPFYFIFIKYWQALSMNPVYLRLPSLILSFFILFFVPILGAKIYPKSKSFPLILLFLFALSHSQISLTMVARPYPFTILCILISFICYLDMMGNLTKEKRKQKELVFVLSTFFAFSTDYSAAWIFVGYGFHMIVQYILTRDKRVFRNLFLPVLYSGMTSLIWIPLLVERYSRSMMLTRHLQGFSGEGNPFELNLYQLNFFLSITSQDLVVEYLHIKKEIWFLFVACMTIIGVWIATVRQGRNALVFISMLVFPPLVSFIYSLFVDPIFISRNLFIVNMAYMVFLAFVIALTPRWVKFIIMLFLVANFMTAFPGLHFTENPYDWLSIIRIFREHPKAIKNIYVPEKPARYFALTSYYERYLPVGLVRVFLIPSDMHMRKGDNYISFISEKKYPVLEENAVLTDFARTYGCNPKQFKIDYVYFAQCE